MAETILCSVSGCSKPNMAKGLCQMHYTRQRRHGDPLSTKSTPKGAAQNYYLDVVFPYDGDECLMWPYSNIKGYGQVSRNGEMVFVSRLLCEDEYGSPPTGDHHAAHSCGNGHLGCVTRKHLRWATPQENTQDKMLHGTVRRGERHGMSKLTDIQVKDILSMRGKKHREEIAAIFGISKNTVSGIHSGRLWKWFDRT